MYSKGILMKYGRWDRGWLFDLGQISLRIAPVGQASLGSGHDPLRDFVEMMFSEKPFEIIPVDGSFVPKYQPCGDPLELLRLFLTSKMCQGRKAIGIPLSILEKIAPFFTCSRSNKPENGRRKECRHRE